MNKNKNTPAIVIICVFAALGILLWMFNRDKGRHFSWYENYELNNEQPYGTQVVAELLKSYYPDKKFEVVNRSLAKWLQTEEIPLHSNYVFIGEQMATDTARIDKLLGFIAKGNTAFISTNIIPTYLVSSIYDHECGYWGEYIGRTKKNVTAHFYNSQLTEGMYNFQFTVADSIMNYNWRSFNDRYFCDSVYSIVPLGHLDSNQVNFVKFGYGKGKILLHTNPIFFTNVQLLKEPSVAYAEKVFSHLDHGNIYWDEHSKISSSNFGGNQASPLSFILSQRALTWAWYLALGLALFYILFYVKRKQRIIPVLEQNLNSSLAFINTIGRLTYSQQNHQSMCRLKMRSFLNFVRNRYRIQTNNLNEEFVQQLSSKSLIDKPVIEKLMEQFKMINAAIVEVNDETLINFYKSIEEFYQTCK